MQELAARLLDHERESGNDIKPWNCLGFEGLHAGGVGFGDVDEMSLMRLSGPTAYTHWREATQHATNVSRFDVQVTLRLTCHPQDLVLQHHAEALAHANPKKRKPAVDLRISNVRPPTLYLNQRTSSRFGRVYDKGGESKLDHYQNCIRYEAQFNGKCGLYASRHLESSEVAQDAAAAMVAGFFCERGLELAWPDVEPRSLTNPRSRTNAFRRLAWLRKQVAPCVEDLLKRNMHAEVADALRLSEATLRKLIGPHGP